MQRPAELNTFGVSSTHITHNSDLLLAIKKYGIKGTRLQACHAAITLLSIYDGSAKLVVNRHSIELARLNTYWPDTLLAYNRGETTICDVLMDKNSGTPGVYLITTTVHQVTYTFAVTAASTYTLINKHPLLHSCPPLSMMLLQFLSNIG